jgi:flavin-binding protein dodecin
VDDRIIELLYRNLQEVFGEGDDHVSPPIQAASLYTNSVPQYAKGGVPMAKVQSDSVYRIIDVVGVSETSWEDAGRKAVETAAGSLRDLRVAEVTKMDMKVDNGKVTAFRTRVALSFKYEVE